MSYYEGIEIGKTMLWRVRRESRGLGSSKTLSNFTDFYKLKVNVLGSLKVPLGRMLRNS